MNIAIFGGTFNPFHSGHEKMLSAICNIGYIDKVLVIPDYLPPHKKTDYLASDTDRYNMCKIICEEYEKSEVSDIEIKREGKSYTVDTVKQLKDIYKNADFYFVLGGDMVSILDKWYKWEELLREIKFIAFSRNDDEEFIKNVDKMKSKGTNIKIVYEEIPDISSTDFRKTLNFDLLPEKISEYIKNKGIYNAR